MRLAKISIENFRSIREAREVRVEALQALVGENNAGKSNILRAVRCFLSAGAGGMEVSHFRDATKAAIIECEFDGLTTDEARRLRRYLIQGRVVLRKELTIDRDERKGKTTVGAEYHGYLAEPKDPRYSMKKIEETGKKADWNALADSSGIKKYASAPGGKINKTEFEKALNKFLQENDVEYEEPTLGDTQALGLAQNLLSALPEIYLLPAITDYSDEIDRRSNTTVFRRLMADLADRLIRSDPKYPEIEEALSKVRSLLNSGAAAGSSSRLKALGSVEVGLLAVLARLMPSVRSVHLGVEVDECQDIFSRGVSVRIDDGCVTDVLDKGHGTQRCLVFAFLRMLIDTQRKAAGGSGSRPIILAIEEPELYIHPHCQRLVFNVLKEFAGSEGGGPNSDQVLYTTHSPAFVEVANYDRIAVVRKHSEEAGTTVQQCPANALGSVVEKKAFKTLTCFGLKHNEVFFCRHAILVEGAEDEVGIIATARKLKRIKELPDEIGVSIVVADGKGDIPKFQRVLNAFGLRYGVLLELDGKPETDPQSKSILDELNGNRLAKLPKRLEDLVGLSSHFKDQRHAKEFFSDAANINTDLETAVSVLLPDPAESTAATPEAGAGVTALESALA